MTSWLVDDASARQALEHGPDDAVAASRVELEGAGRHRSDSGRDAAANHRARTMQPRLHGFFPDLKSL